MATLFLDMREQFPGEIKNRNYQLSVCGYCNASENRVLRLFFPFFKKDTLEIYTNVFTTTARYGRDCRYPEMIIHLIGNRVGELNR